MQLTTNVPLNFEPYPFKNKILQHAHNQPAVPISNSNFKLLQIITDIILRSFKTDIDFRPLD